MLLFTVYRPRRYTAKSRQHCRPPCPPHLRRHSSSSASVTAGATTARRTTRPSAGEQTGIALRVACATWRKLAATRERRLADERGRVTGQALPPCPAAPRGPEALRYPHPLLPLNLSNQVGRRRLLRRQRRALPVVRRPVVATIRDRLGQGPVPRDPGAPQPALRPVRDRRGPPAAAARGAHPRGRRHAEQEHAEAARVR
jgi:hypothetical protein